MLTHRPGRKRNVAESHKLNKYGADHFDWSPDCWTYSSWLCFSDPDIVSLKLNCDGLRLVQQNTFIREIFYSREGINNVNDKCTSSETNLYLTTKFCRLFVRFVCVNLTVYSLFMSGTFLQLLCRLRQQHLQFPRRDCEIHYCLILHYHSRQCFDAKMLVAVHYRQLNKQSLLCLTFVW